MENSYSLVKNEDGKDKLEYDLNFLQQFDKYILIHLVHFESDLNDKVNLENDYEDHLEVESSMVC